MNPLLLRVDEIQESSQPWESDLSRELIDETLAGPPATEYKADGASHVTANLTKMGREVLVRGHFNAPLEGQCKRCLKPLKLSTPVDFTLNYVPSEELEKAAPKKGAPVPVDEAPRKGKRKRRDDDEAPAGSFDPGLTDVELYGGKSIDLTPALREHLLLALPPSPLCTEDCKGLCLFCGSDLNEAVCGHRQESIDPRWQALKTIQLEKKE